MEGGCACGSLRYRAAGAGAAWFCHCRACQRATGAPAVAYARVVEVATTGPVATTTDATHGERVFCPACGTAPLRRDGDAVLVAVTTLDDPDAARPTAHLAVDAQRPWHKPWDGLGRAEGADVPDPLPASWRAKRAPELDGASPVTLRPIDDTNRMAVIGLMVSGAQARFVAPNVLSLLQQLVHTGESWLRAIYAADAPVGLALVDFPAEDELGLPLAGKPFLWRFMVDEHYQGLGYGARGLELVFDAMRERGHDTIFVSAVPGTGSPIPFYLRRGFEPTGVSEGEEDVFRRAL